MQQIESSRGSNPIMDQISIKASNPKCRLFLKIDQQRYLAAGVYLPEAPDRLPPPPPTPVTHCLNTVHAPLYLFTQGRGEVEPVRRLEGH
jgi:hypothetical protein